MVLCICICNFNDAWAPPWLLKCLGIQNDQDSRALSADTFDEEPSEDQKYAGLLHVLLENKFLSSLLGFIPLGILSHLCGWSKPAVFVCNFFAVLPLAWLIGKTTEDLAASSSAVVGGLLNATFGNVVEMLLCIAGIRQNQISVVQCTLIGSILSNMLLVLGTTFLWGGCFFKTQRFSGVGASIQSSMMLLSVLSFVLPTTFSILIPASEAVPLISRVVAILLFAMYVQLLVFQIKTHPDLFEGDDDGEEEQADMSPKEAAIALGVFTVITSICTEYLIDAIEGTIESWNVTKEFIGIIILPIIGNAVEHYTAIVVGGRNKMDLSLGVAVGSSCQMALLVTPFTVLVGWFLDRPMTLDFHPFQATVLLLSVVLVANIVKDGTSHWLLGSMLVTAYFTIAMIYFYEKTGLAGNLELDYE